MQQVQGCLAYARVRRIQCNDEVGPEADRIVVVLTASADAPVSTEPQDVRLLVRPLVDGKPGEVLSSKTIPMMVLSKP